MDHRQKDLSHIWCVIPVYNNKDTVKSIALDCQNYLSNILIVDDGSTDIDIGALFADTQIPVLKHDHNQGKGQAILTGLKYVSDKNARFMITIDADGQHLPKDLEKFIPLLDDDDTFLVIGCRCFDCANVPEKSRFGRQFANFWLRVETGARVDDCQSGFRAYPLKYLNKLKCYGSKYDFEAEILARAAWAGLDFKMVDIDVYYPEPERRVTSFHPFWDNFRLSLMHSRLVGRRLAPLPHKKLVKQKNQNPYPEFLKNPLALLKILLRENVSPEGLGAAAAVGTFLGALPLVSVHTLVIIYVAARLHLNKIMAISIQNICMPPLVPALCIELGHFMRNGYFITEVSWQVIFGEIPDRLFEWLLGSLIVAPILAAMVGLIVFFIARYLQRRSVQHVIS